MSQETEVRMKKVPFDPQTFLDHYAGMWATQREARWAEHWETLSTLTHHYDWLKPEWKAQVGPKLNEWLRSHDKATRLVALDFARTLALPETLWTLRWVQLLSLLMPWRWGSFPQVRKVIRRTKRGERLYSRQAK